MKRFALALAAFLVSASSFALDHNHSAWDLLLKKHGKYDEPRVHVAVVCAAIGCPMLRNEAATPEKVEAQLEDGMRRFLSDRTGR